MLHPVHEKYHEVQASSHCCVRTIRDGIDGSRLIAARRDPVTGIFEKEFALKEAEGALGTGADEPGGNAVISLAPEMAPCLEMEVFRR